MEVRSAVFGVHCLSASFCRGRASGLNWLGRGFDEVTLKKLECSKQAKALNTLAWNNARGLGPYFVGLQGWSND